MRIGSTLMLLGAAVFAVGLLMRFAPGLFSWFGNLPGDIRYESERSRVFIPITSMILLSIAATIAVNLWRTFRGR